MIPELGHYSLILALAFALAQAFAPAVIKPRAAFLVFFLTLAAFSALVYAYVTSDFSLVNVMQNSHTTKPLLYKISGAWGNHEGSMLLWALMLSFFAFLMSRAKLDENFRTRVLSVQGSLASGFIAFILLTSNPFARIPPVFIPEDGMGLNPVLQHPALSIHPPLLYMGYVGFSVAFAFAVAGLRGGKIDQDWAKALQPWVLLAWTALSAGVALGSWWAYEELGWGGWWFWDPVENSSLMPWLLGTALLHSILVLKKRGALARWCALLSILTFSLALLGTFLVRSGVLTSVHAFATDPLRGVVILALITFYTGGALLSYALNAHRLESHGGFSGLSRESAIIIGNLFLACACFTVLTGTLYPLLMEFLRAEAVSVGPPYFIATFLPLTAPVVILAGMGHLIAWKKAEISPLLRNFRTPLVMTALGLALMYFTIYGVTFAALAGFACGLWLMFATLYDLAARIQLFKISYGDSFSRARGMKLSFWGMFLAHLGMGVAILGMFGSVALMQEKTVLLKEKQKLEIGSYELTLEDVGSVTGPNYVADRAIISLDNGLKLMPERRYYPAEEQTTTEAADKTYLSGDIYVALGEEDPGQKGHFVIRAYTHPLIGFLWGGFAMTIFGGILSFIARRRSA